MGLRNGRASSCGRSGSGILPSEEILAELEPEPRGRSHSGELLDPEFLAHVSELNPRLKHTQFADYHGHGWNFRAVFKRDRSGNLLDDNGAVVANPTSEVLQRAMAPRTDEEWKNGRPGIPVHLKDIHLERGMHCVDCHFAGTSTATATCTANTPMRSKYPASIAMERSITDRRS